ncbi:MAG: helix-turn-helix transcriptional regulator [Sedimenticola sp.]
MGNIGSRIRPLREFLNLGRAEFADLTEIKKDTLIKIERGRQRPTEELIEGIGKHWPEYLHWLITGTANPDLGQTSPEIEELRRSG